MRAALALVALLSLLFAVACGSGGGAKTATPASNACGAPVTASAGSCGGAGGATTPPASTTAGAATTPVSDLLVGLPQDGQTLGNASAPLKVALYQNFLCPHCRDFALEIMPQMLIDYVATGKVAIVFHDAALGAGAADIAHEAARCAADQGKFWPAYFALYQNFADDPASYTKARMESVLAPTGVDAAKLASCLDSDQHQAEVDAATSEFEHLADNNAAYANALATVQAGNGPAIPLLDIAGTYLTAPEDYATVKAAIDAKLGP